MSNLTTLNNQFVFNLPLDFLSDQIEDKHIKILKAKRKWYSTTLDYLNSNILSITFPSINFPVVSNPQNLQRKQILWKTVGNVYDLFSKDITVTFECVDSNWNYLIMLEALTNHYLNTQKAYDEALIITVVDENKHALYHIQFRDVIWTGLSDNTLGYNDVNLTSKTFTCTFTSNFMDIEFVADKSDIISGNNYNGNFPIN